MLLIYGYLTIEICVLAWERTPIASLQKTSMSMGGKVMEGQPGRERREVRGVPRWLLALGPRRALQAGRCVAARMDHGWVPGLWISKFTTRRGEGSS